jgi:NDP-sugar pyrophosphorylase family protein
MKALILAGGFGTRLYPLTWGRPKSMVPIANRPFMERALDWLARAGIQEVIIALNHMPERISEHFGTGRQWGVKLSYIIEDTPLGSGGAIRNATSLLADETFLVINGDILTDLDLKQMTAFHRERGSQISISLAKVEDPSHYGVVDMEPDGRLRRFVEKPPRAEAPSNFINAGVWLFEPEMLAEMPPIGEPFSVERAFWPACLARGVRMYGYYEDCYWIDIGTLEHYRQVHQDLLAGKINIEFKEHETQPGIWVGAGAQVAAGAAITAPVIIGEHARIAAGAQISNSVIGPDCVVETGAQVTECVLWEKVRIGTGMQVHDCVIGARQEITQKSLFSEACCDAGACAPQ